MTRATSSASRRRLLALGVCGFLLGACTSEAAQLRDDDGTIVAAGQESVYSLQEGDCLAPDPALTGEVSELPVVPCDQPHTQEVFAKVELDDGPYPGPEEVQQLADVECIGALESALGRTLADGLFVSYLLPSFTGWNDENEPDRQVVCVLVFPDRVTAVGSAVEDTLEMTPVDPSTETATEQS